MIRGTSALAAVFLFAPTIGCGDPCLDDGFGNGMCPESSSAGASSDSSSSGAESMDSSSDSAGDGDTATTGDGTTGDGTTGDGDGTTGDGTTGDGTTGDGDGTTGDGTTGDGDGTTGDGTTGDGTTGDGDGCAGSMNFEIDAGDAMLQGWDVEVSLADTGQYIFPTSMNGTANFEVDVPCDGTWWIWVRGWDQVDADSFNVEVDGQPGGGGEIFDLDCTGTPSGEGIYRWTRLNARSTTGGCDTSGPNDWSFAWTPGVHDVTFRPRESDALSRIVVTNDDAFVPN